MSSQFKRIISSVLVIAMIFANNGFSVLAGSVDDIVEEASKETTVIQNYFEYEETTVAVRTSLGVQNAGEEAEETETLKENTSEAKANNEVAPSSDETEDEGEKETTEYAEEPEEETTKEESEAEENETTKEESEESETTLDESKEVTSEETTEAETTAEESKEETTSQEETEESSVEETTAETVESETAETKETETTETQEETQAESSETTAETTVNETFVDNANAKAATESEADKVVLAEEATKSDLKEVIIATVPTTKWTIKELNIATYSKTETVINRDFLNAESVSTSAAERLKKEVTVTVVNEKGEEKQVTVPLKWKLAKNIVIDKVDLATESVAKPESEIREKYEVEKTISSIVATVSSINNKDELIEKIRNSSEEYKDKEIVIVDGNEFSVDRFVVDEKATLESVEEVESVDAETVETIVKAIVETLAAEENETEATEEVKVDPAAEVETTEESVEVTEAEAANETTEVVETETEEVTEAATEEETTEKVEETTINLVMVGNTIYAFANTDEETSEETTEAVEETTTEVAEPTEAAEATEESIEIVEETTEATETTETTEEAVVETDDAEEETTEAAEVATESDAKDSALEVENVIDIGTRSVLEIKQINIYELDTEELLKAVYDAVYGPDSTEEVDKGFLQSIVDMIFGNGETESDDVEVALSEINFDPMAFVVEELVLGATAGYDHAEAGAHLICGYVIPNNGRSCIDGGAEHKYIGGANGHRAIYNPVFVPLLDTNRLVVGTNIATIYEAEAYYLTKDIEVDKDWYVTLGSEDVDKAVGLTICLNGHSLTFGPNSRIRGAGRFNLCNCGSTGGGTKSYVYTKKPNSTGGPLYTDAWNTWDTTTNTYVNVDIESSTALKDAKYFYLSAWRDGVATKLDSKTNNRVLLYKNFPLAETDTIGVYGGPAGINFVETKIEAHYMNKAMKNQGNTKQTPKYQLNHPDPNSGQGSLFYGNTVEISNCTFTSCEAIRTNGVAANARNTMYVENSTFNNLYSNERGGALSINGTTAAIWKSNFINCEAASDGGAIVGYGPYKFENNTTIYENPGNLTNTNIVIEESKFENCKAGANGGAIALDQFKALKISENTTFLNNQAQGNGGAIYINGYLNDTYADIQSAVVLENTRFDGNTAKNSKGGAIYTNYDAKKDLVLRVSSNVKFTANSAVGTQMPVYKRGSNSEKLRKDDIAKYYEELQKYISGKTSEIKAADVAYSENVNSYGGAIAIKGNVLLNIGRESGGEAVTGIEMTENTAANGGAVWAGAKSTVYVNKAIVKKNTHLAGTTLYYENVVASKIGSSAEQNEVAFSNTSGGGAFYLQGGASMKIDESANFTENTNTIYLNKASLSIINNNTIYGNTGNYLIAYANQYSNAVEIRDSHISTNKFTRTMGQAQYQRFGSSYDFTFNALYQTTYVKFIGDVSIQGNYDTKRLIGDSDQAAGSKDPAGKWENDIFVNINTLRFDLTKGFTYNKQIKLMFDPKDKNRVIYNTWNKASVRDYSNNITFNNMFDLDNVKNSIYTGLFFYRDGENIYFGDNYTKVNFLYATPGAEGKEQFESQYFYRYSTNSLIVRPYTDASTLNIDNHTFCGWMGRAVNNTVKEENGKYKVWDFANDYIYLDGSEETNLYAVYTDDLVIMRSCGSSEACRHDVLPNGVVHTPRGGARSFTDTAKERNWVVVSSLPQLYYSVNGKHTQYILAADIEIPANAEPFAGDYVINLNCHTLDVEYARGPLFNAGTYTNTIQDTNGSRLVISGLADADAAKVYAGNAIGGIESKKALINFNADNYNKAFLNMDGKDVYIKDVQFTNVFADEPDDCDAFFIDTNNSSLNNTLYLDSVDFGSPASKDFFVLGASLARVHSIKTNNVHLENVNFAQDIIGDLFNDNLFTIDLNQLGELYITSTGSEVRKAATAQSGARSTGEMTFMNATFSNVKNAKTLFAVEDVADMALNVN